jgi:transcriptional antiterminator RfaH
MTNVTAPEDLKIQTGPRWYAAQTRATYERVAILNLEDQGFQCFLPMIEKTIRHARKVTPARRALFPGYVFTKIDLTRDRWRSINGTRGVMRLIMADNRPQPVPEGVVEHMQAQIDARGLYTLGDGFTIGARVEIISGPLAQNFGEIVALDDRGRARVLLDILNGKIAVRLQRAALSAA